MAKTIKVSARIERKEVLLFYGCPSHLNIDLLKELRGDGIVVLFLMTNTSHDTNEDYLITFGIAKTEFQN